MSCLRNGRSLDFTQYAMSKYKHIVKRLGEYVNGQSVLYRYKEVSLKGGTELLSKPPYMYKDAFTKWLFHYFYYYPSCCPVPNSSTLFERRFSHTWHGHRGRPVPSTFSGTHKYLQWYSKYLQWYSKYLQWYSKYLQWYSKYLLVLKVPSVEGIVPSVVLK
jgi:hypothetical protein